jgi:hypothetical protein
MSSSSTTNPSSAMAIFTEPVCQGIVASLADRFVMGNPDMKQNMIFGASVGVGNSLGDLVSISFASTGESLFGDSPGLYTGSTLTMRLLEVGASTGIAYGLNKYGLLNDFSNDMYKKIGVIVASSVAGTYMFQYIQGKALDYAY